MEMKKRRVRIYEYGQDGKIIATGKEGRLFAIDVPSGWTMVEIPDGSLVKIFHTLVKLI